MPTTRSASKKQDGLDDVKEGEKFGLKPKVKKGASRTSKTSAAVPKPQDPKANTSAKRKRPAGESQTKKRAKTDGVEQAHFASHDGDEVDSQKPIIINRSPVLQLWSASVARFLHPHETWETCLSVGGSIATLCAISKGRAIGQIEPKDESANAKDKSKEHKQEAETNVRELEVMGFPMHIRDNVVVVNGKPKPLNENLLLKKFSGEENYQRVKKVMEDALKTWKDEKPELDKKAFHTYEKFRPQIAAGSSGWGRKGELNVHEIKMTTER